MVYERSLMEQFHELEMIFQHNLHMDETIIIYSIY